MNNNLLQQMLIYYPLYGILIYFVWTIRANSKKDPRIDDIKQKLEEIEKKFDNYVSKVEVKPIKKNVANAHIKIDKLDAKIDKEITEVKTDITQVKMTLQEKIENEIEKSIRLKTFLTQQERDKLDMKIMEDNLRRSVDFNRVDSQLHTIASDVMDIYFKDHYLGRKEAYDISTGLFNMPDITEKRKTDDIKNIYENIMDIVDKKYLTANLDFVYDLSRIETKAFLIEKYIVPAYTTRIESMIADWQNIQARLAEDSKEREKEQQLKQAEERQRKEKANSDLGKFEAQIGEIYRNLQEEKGDR